MCVCLHKGLLDVDTLLNEKALSLLTFPHMCITFSEIARYKKLSMREGCAEDAKLTNALFLAPMNVG